MFDDHIPIAPMGQSEEEQNEMPMDFIGRAKVSLYPLINDKIISESLSLTNSRGIKVGTLWIKIFWKDHREQQRKKQAPTEFVQNWDTQMTKQIAEKLKKINLSINQAFSMFDTD